MRGTVSTMQQTVDRKKKVRENGSTINSCCIDVRTTGKRKKKKTTSLQLFYTEFFFFTCDFHVSIGTAWSSGWPRLLTMRQSWKKIL